MPGVPGKMTPRQAFKIAIACIQKQMRIHAFDANLYLAGQMTPHTERAHAEYIRLAEAVKIINGLVEKRMR